MRKEFKELEISEIKEKEKRIREQIKFQYLLSDIITELEKIGHKKINCKIETKIKEILDKKGIEYKVVGYQNFDKVYGNDKYLDRSIYLNFPNVYGVDTYIDTEKTGYNSEMIGGYYDKLFEANKILIKENIKEREQKLEKQLKFAYDNIDRYNEMIETLSEMKSELGFLGY